MTPKETTEQRVSNVNVKSTFFFKKYVLKRLKRSKILENVTNFSKRKC